MNHIEYRKRDFQDDVNSVLHTESTFEKKKGIVVIPEPPTHPIVSWSRDEVCTMKSKKCTPDKLDEMIMKCTTWPLKTDSLCHHCCHKFDTTPVPIPETYDSLRRIYICKGFFCSWQCAKAYNLNYMNGSGSGNRNMNISILAHKMWIKYLKINCNSETGQNLKNYGVHSINPAENRLVLKSFGGTMEIEEYRKGFFGIVPPEEAITGLPFLSIKQKLSLPFVDGESKTLTTTEPLSVDSSSLGMNLGNLRSLRRTQRMETPKAHKESNDFCEMLNRAKNDNIVMKRTRKEEDTNNLFSCMGVTVSKKPKK